MTCILHFMLHDYSSDKTYTDTQRITVRYTDATRALSTNDSPRKRR